MAKGVTYERILNARSEPQNWLTYYGAYDGQRYSPLDQINKENVKQLTPAWVFQCRLGGPALGQVDVLVRGLPDRRRRDHVRLRLGRLGLGPRRPERERCCGSTGTRSRSTCRCAAATSTAGSPSPRARSSSTTLNAHIIALDAETGKKVWDQTYGDVRAGESATVAPLVVKDMVIVGSSGGEFGVRGHTDAFKLETGERVWRRYMVPKPGEPGSETWPADGEAWARGGANCWVTPHVRPGPEPPVLRDRQPVSRLRRRRPRGRQPLHRLRCRRRRRHRRDQGALPVHPARPVGLRLRDGAHPVRPRRAEAGGPLRQERVHVHPRPHEHGGGPGGAVRRPHRLGRGRREGQRDAEGLPRQGGRPGPLLARAGRRQGMDARVLQPEDRAPLRARCRTSARRPPGGAGSSRRASRTGARASPWTSRTWPAT